MSVHQQYEPQPGIRGRFWRFWSAYVNALERYLDSMGHRDKDLPAATKSEIGRGRRGPTRQTAKGESKMKIKVTTLHVDDQERALRFYTEVLGFVKKADFSNGPYRWLTVASAEEPNGTELQLALNTNPAAKAYQQALFQQGEPAAMFFTDDLQADYERMKALGAEFAMPPTDVPASKIARVNDTCGNLIQLTQLLRW